jgi:hypothetical protein
VVLAFEMGFFPLWLIAVVFTFLLIIIVYTIIAWVKASRSGGMTNGGAVG